MTGACGSSCSPKYPWHSFLSENHRANQSSWNCGFFLASSENNIAEALHLIWRPTPPVRLNTKCIWIGTQFELFYFRERKIEQPWKNSIFFLKKKKFFFKFLLKVTALSRKEGFGTAVPEWVEWVGRMLITAPSLLYLKISSLPRSL